MGTLDRSVERSRASPRSGRSKGPSDDARPRGGVTRKGEPSGPGYAGHILCMCRHPLCPFLRCMKFLLMQRLTCPIRRFSGFTGGEMNFHIVCGEATHGGKLCGVRAADGWGNRKEPGTVYRSRLFSQRPYTAVRYTSANTFLAIRTPKFAACDFGGGGES